MFNSSLFSKPWFVCAIIFGCFAIITPRILIPMIKQLLGLNQPVNRDHHNNDALPINRPNMFAGRGGGGGGDAKIPTETLRRQGPVHGAGANADHGSSSSSKSMLAFILPVYTVGIAVYMVYTLCKVYGNKKQPDDTSKELENQLNAKKNSIDSNYQKNIKWDPIKKQFVFKQPDLEPIYADEDVDDHIDEYENLDKDYVKFVKEKRRKQKLEQQKTTNNSSDMNNLLIQMKESLNNINLKLTQSDKNSGPVDDDDLQSIKLQLAQTELQMAKVLQTIDSLATSSEDLQEKVKQNFQDDENDDENHRHRHSHHRHLHHHHKSKKSKSYKLKRGSKKYTDSSDQSTSSSSSTSTSSTDSSESDESSVKSASSSEKKYKKSSKKIHSRHKKSNKKMNEKKSKAKNEPSSSSNESDDNETNNKNECNSNVNDEILNYENSNKQNENIEQLNRYSSQSSSDTEDKKTK